MVAPGMQLEFEEGPSFERTESKVPGLAEAVKKQYAEHPNKMVSCSPVLKKGELRFDGKSYEFLLYRKGPTKVFLLTVVEEKNSVGISKADLEHFMKLFKR